MQIDIGLSPCPNDTFIFDALLHGRIDTGPYRFRPIFADVEELNRMASHGKLTVTKLSYYAYLSRMNHYVMMHSGGALGRGVGPLLVRARELHKAKSEWSVAIPGVSTTANFLLSYTLPEITNKTERIFHEIEGDVSAGRFDAGVLIHENRFTYKERGLSLIADLGSLWEEKTGVAIPLGGIAIQRNQPIQVQRDIDQLIKESVEYAQLNPAESHDFVAHHAQEMDSTVRQQHIDLYVNEETLGLSGEGYAAVEKMHEIYIRNHPEAVDSGSLFVSI